MVSAQATTAAVNAVHAATDAATARWPADALDRIRDGGRRRRFRDDRSRVNRRGLRPGYRALERFRPCPSGLPRLPEVQAWDTARLTNAAQWWAGAATRWEGGFAEVVRQSFTPGAGRVEGQRGNLGQERAAADRPQVNRSPSAFGP